MAVIALALAAGFLAGADWAQAVWPWPTTRLSDLFLASILAAVGAPMIWIAAANEPRAMEAGAVDLAVMYAGMSATVGLQAASGDAKALVFATVLGVFTLPSLAAFVWSRRFEFRDPRPMPVAVRVSFGVFAVALAWAAAELITGAPHIFPWPLPEATSAAYGWIFAGAATYFAFGVLRGRWANACGQLIGFLVYDLILIGPFVAHVDDVLPAHRPSLSIYTSVLVYSGLLATYFLFVHPATRFSRADLVPSGTAT